MLIPELRQLKGHMLELHGSPDSGKTKEVLHYIREEQKTQQLLVCYFDAANRLQDSGEFAHLDKQYVWLSFDINNEVFMSLLRQVMEYADLIVIDDITLYRKNLWRFLESLRKMTIATDTAVILVNQRRFVLNHHTGIYEDRPYRFNAIQQYCSYSIDLDKRELRQLENFQDAELDSDIEELLAG